MKPLKILTLTLMSACLISTQVPAALAAKKAAKKKVQPEVYSSVEPGVVTVTTMVPVQQMPAPADSEDSDAPPLPPPPVPVSAPSEATIAVVPENAVKMAQTFEPVPTEQASLIAKRLPLIEKLMVKHGRAYDYRSHTVKQLQAILDDLDRAEKAQTE